MSYTYTDNIKRFIYICR